MGFSPLGSLVWLSMHRDRFGVRNERDRSFFSYLTVYYLMCKKRKGKHGRECAQAPERLAGEERSTRTVDVGMLVLGELMPFKLTSENTSVKYVLDTLTFACDTYFVAGDVNDLFSPFRCLND